MKDAMARSEDDDANLQEVDSGSVEADGDPIVDRDGDGKPDGKKESESDAAIEAAWKTVKPMSPKFKLKDAKFHCTAQTKTKKMYIAITSQAKASEGGGSAKKE